MAQRTVADLRCESRKSMVIIRVAMVWIVLGVIALVTGCSTHRAGGPTSMISELCSRANARDVNGTI